MNTAKRSIRSHIKDTKYSLNPKNKTHHQKFSVSCTVYINNAFGESALSESYIIAAPIDINKNKTDHTIGNKYPGGDKGG